MVHKYSGVNGKGRRVRRDSGTDESSSNTTKVRARAACARVTSLWCGLDFQRERLEFLLDYLFLSYGNYG